RNLCPGSLRRLRADQGSPGRWLGGVHLSLGDGGVRAGRLGRPADGCLRCPRPAEGIMNVQRAVVVLVDFPYPTGTGSKVRPALVIQNDLDTRRLFNTILAQ